jgi:hypothetical protein
VELVGIGNWELELVRIGRTWSGSVPELVGLDFGIGQNWSDLAGLGSGIGRTWPGSVLELVGLGRTRSWNWSDLVSELVRIGRNWLELVEICLSYFLLRKPRINMKLARGIVT